MKDDVISRQWLMECVDEGWVKFDTEKDENIFIHLVRDIAPSAQSESYKEKLKEIADALSEKFAYMNTCPNERDIILGYLGVKRSNEIHCNTDCTHIKCKSYHFDKKLPSAQPEQETGHWVYDPDGMDWNLPAWRCSECGGKNTMIPTTIQYKDGPHRVMNPYRWAGSKYCPNCGVKMEGNR